MTEERLIKDGDIILDGTGPRYEKEEAAFRKLERIEGILEQYDLTVDELESVLYYIKSNPII